MNLKIKSIAAAVALAVSGVASATAIPSDGLFFSAWNGNPDAPSSIVINLGVTSATFLSDPEQAYTLMGSSLATLSTWLAGAADITKVEWGVSAAMPIGANDPLPPPTYGVLATATNAELPDQQYNWGQFTGLDSAVANFSNFLTSPILGNANLGGTDAFAASNVNQLFSPSFDGGIGVDAMANVGAAMSFYQFFVDQDGNSFFEGDLIEHGTWELVFAGGQAGLTYSTSPVPLPAAVWLLGSALLGLAGVSRRKNVAA